MADVTPIVASVQVDTGNANANLKEVKKNINDVKGALGETGKAAQAAGKDVSNSSGSFGKLKEQLSAVSPAAAGAAEGAGKFGSALKVLAANPIVLILTGLVAVLTLVYTAFKNTFAGGEKVEQVFAGIKAVGQSLLDSLDKIGSSIVKLFKFDFSGAIADMKAVGNAAADAYNKMSSLTAEAQKLKREQLANDLDSAERAKKLAILREQATDDNVPIAKRKAALKELQAEAEKNAKEDIDLAKRTSDNKIAQLTLEKDGAKKNAEEINKIKIEQINGETENANELRRINKQVTAAEKQEQAERTAAAKAGAEKRKEDREKLEAANGTLLKLQQENQLLAIKDGYQKELQQLENRIADEKRANLKAFNDKKLTREQYNAIEAAEATKANLQRDAIIDKHNLEIAKKEEDFQKELNTITTRTRIAGITDARQLEKIQLEIGYEEKLKDAAIRYKDDADKFLQIKTAIDEEQKAAQAKIDLKNKKEDDKKKLDDEKKKLAETLADPTQSFDAKQAALDADVAANQAAFDAKAISEDEFTKNKQANTEARKALDQAELASKLATLGAVGDALGTLSDIIGKQTAVGKALAVSQAIISTIQSAVNSFNSLSGIPIVGPALGAIAAAGAAAAGYANVKKILAVQVPGGGGGGAPSMPGLAAAPAPVSPTASTTQLDAKSISDMGNAAAGGVNRSVRAYVVESDNAEAANRAARLASASVLGGG